MKYNKLSLKRQSTINRAKELDIDWENNIIFIGTTLKVPDETLHNYFEYCNV